MCRMQAVNTLEWCDKGDKISHSRILTAVAFHIMLCSEPSKLFYMHLDECIQIWMLVSKSIFSEQFIWREPNIEETRSVFEVHSE